MNKEKHFHLIRIGGISMSGIAEMLLKKGYQVSGSDIKDSQKLKKLRSLGAKIYIGHRSANLANADLVVYSSAIKADNPEIRYARKQGITVIKRAQMLAELMKDKEGIAVAGTHGKTTTTSMIATLLIEGGIDPGILVGGNLDIIKGNSYLGRGKYFLTEADESDGSFLCYNPKVVVVTNIELDHQDYYGSRDNLIKTFRLFINNIPEDGTAVLCVDDKNIMEIIKPENNRFLTYGIKKGILRADDCKFMPFGSYYNLIYKDKLLGEINLQVPGQHNILNSLAAAGVGLYTGMEFMDIKRGLEKYRGVRRRFEKKGMVDNILVIDDYAHHPTEIRETLKTAKNTGFNRIIGIFQPHRYSRTKFLMEDFSRSFTLIDHLIITDIYAAGEKPIAGVDSDKLAGKISKRGIKVDYISEQEGIVNYLQKIVKPQDLIITIGAGDVYRVGELFIKEMKKFKEMA